MEFLQSKNFSLICAALNGYFAITALFSGNILFFLVCGAFCAICSKNYIDAP